MPPLTIDNWYVQTFGSTCVQPKNLIGPNRLLQKVILTYKMAYKKRRKSRSNSC
jgi:hypothetical protein